MLERVRAFCGHPRMMDPEFVTNPAEHAMSEQLLGNFGCFQAADNRVYINVAEVLLKLGSENLEPVLIYQFLHYALAPFDVRTALRLTLAAKLALEEVGGREVSFEEARAIQRLFCDVICVTYAARQGLMDEMIGLYRAMDRLRSGQPDRAWRALLTLFEELWECRGDRNHKAELIQAVGYDVFPVSRGEDLVRVVAGKAEELYKGMRSHP